MTDEVAGTPPRTRFTDRSAPTRRAILAAAQNRFAKEGYEKATLRAIAQDAGVTAAMVLRYFDSKAHLFARSTAAGFVDLDLRRLPHEEFGVRFTRAALEPWEAGSDTAMEALHRAAMTNDDAARAVQTLVDQQVLPALRALFPEDPHVDERAALIHSQGLGIVVGRYLLRLEPLASMNFEDLVLAVGRTVQDYIDRPLPGPPSGKTG
jgi:AcrR family transcriptional regulator